MIKQRTREPDQILVPEMEPGKMRWWEERGSLILRSHAHKQERPTLHGANTAKGTYHYVINFKFFYE